MFIYSVRASTIKLALLVLLGVALLVGVGSYAASDAAAAVSFGTVNFDGIKTDEDRVKFIEQFGIKVAPEPIEEQNFRMPKNFDRVILGYNEIQKQQGLDLTKYAGKKVTRYTYRVENYSDAPEGSEVYVNLFVSSGRVIAADISSATPEGFVRPLVTAAE